MSQVRKLLQGSVIKAQESTPGGLPDPNENKKKYGSLTIDGINLGNSEEVYNNFAKYAQTESAKHPEYGDFYDLLLADLRNGEDREATVGNKINTTAGLSKNAHTGFSKWLQSLSPQETKGEIMRRWIRSVRGFKMPEEKVETSEATKINNGRRDFEWYGTEKTGKYQNNAATNDAAWSQVQRYLDYLENKDNWRDKNTFTDKFVDEDALNAWWNRYAVVDGDPEGTTQRAKAQAAVDQWKALISGGTRNDWQTGTGAWEDARENLKLFNIYPDGSVAPKPESTIVGDYSADGQRAARAAADAKVWNEKGSDGKSITKTSWMPNGTDKDKRLYLLNHDRLFDWNGKQKVPGLGAEYENGIYDPKTGRVYTYQEALENLVDEMTAIQTANNSATSIDDLYNKENPRSLWNLLNFTDYPNHNYGVYNSDEHFFSNPLLQKYFTDKGIKSAAVFNPTLGYDVPEGYNIVGYYDFSHDNRNGQHGLRAPYYLISGPDGKLEIRTDLNGFNRIKRDWGTVDDLKNIVYKDASGKRYGVYKDVEDQVGNTHQILIGDDNQFYIKRENGVYPISEALKQKIDSGLKPTRDEMTRGKSEEEYKAGKGPKESALAGKPVSRKEGGSIKVKPLPKYQMGSQFLTKKTLPGNDTLKGSPLDSGITLSSGQDLTASQWWNNLNGDDKKDIAAAGLDILSAVSALIPTPATAATALGLGLTSSALMGKADLNRGRSVGSVLGQSALNVGLDVASAVPWLGEAAAMTKIAKSAGKVGKIVGPLFTAMGLGQAAGALSKVVRGEKLNSEDLLALSAGFQSVLNIGHVKLKSAGDASLASLRRNKVSEVGDATVYRKKTFGDGENAVEVKLTREQAQQIANSGAEAGANLRIALKENNIPESALEVTDTKLLQDWGFNLHLNKKGKAGDAVKRVSLSDEPGFFGKAKNFVGGKDERFTKYGYLTDLVNGTKKRQAYIDKAMQNPTAREQLGTAVDEMQGSALRKLLTQRAYGRAEVRNGLQSTEMGWRRFYQRPEPQNTTEPSTTEAHAANITESPVITPETVDPGTKFVLGAVQPLAKPFSNTYGRPRRQLSGDAESLLPSIRSSREGVLGNSSPTISASRPLKNPLQLPGGPIQVHNSANAAKLQAKRASTKTASLIRELNTKNADPMKVLAKYSKEDIDEAQASQIVEAINNAINGANKKVRVIDGKQLNRDEYRAAIEELFTSMFKDGGVIKAQSGRKGFVGGYSKDNFALQRDALVYGNRLAGLLGAMHSNNAATNNLNKSIDRAASLAQEIAPSYIINETVSPTYYRNLSEIDNRLSRTPYGVKATSNIIDSAAIDNMYQSNWMGQRQQAYNALADAETGAMSRTNQNMNKQIDIWAGTRNNNMKIFSSAEMQKGQNNFGRDQRNAQSLQSWNLQNADDINKWTTAVEDMRMNYATADAARKAQANWITTVRTKYPKYFTEWTNEPNKSLYNNDMNTWLMSKGYWDDTMDDLYSENNVDLQLSQMDTYRKNKLPALLSGFGRIIEEKSGGKVRNRYKNEPWEDIWINHDKATLKASEKLNDNIIRLFLKTLK